MIMCGGEKISSVECLASCGIEYFEWDFWICSGYVPKFVLVFSR